MTVFHLKRPHMKHEETSLRGIRRAAQARDWRGRRKYSEIDLDLLITKDGHVVGCHWGRPMEADGFRDPYHVLARDRTVSSMTLEEVQRLKARTGLFTYRIQTVERLLRECARRKIGAVLEPKSPNFTRADWEHIAKVADEVGAHVRVYALPQNVASLVGAKGAGFNVKEIR